MPPIDPTQIHLAIVTPMANEEADCVAFVERVLAQCSGLASVRHYVVLDRASRDETYNRLCAHAAEEPRLRPVYDSQSSCPVDAYLRGFREALAGGCDWVLEIDGGFSHDPDDIPRFIARMSEGRDCVFGSRALPGGGNVSVPLGRRLLSRGGTILAQLLLGTRMRDMTSGFELFDRAVVEQLVALPIFSVAHAFQTELRTYCRALDWVEVPIAYSSPSPNVRWRFVRNALAVLLRLATQRLLGELPRCRSRQQSGRAPRAIRRRGRRAQDR